VAGVRCVLTPPLVVLQGGTAQPTSGVRGGISSYIVVTHQHSTIRRSVDRWGFAPLIPAFQLCYMQDQQWEAKLGWVTLQMCNCRSDTSHTVQ
jgi:hypothetical protein